MPSAAPNRRDFIGWQVLGVGVRQAWPYIDFLVPDDDTEPRLFIDSDFTVWNDSGKKQRGSSLNRLEPLNLLGVRSASVDPGTGDLSIGFDLGARLWISGEGNKDTTHAPWWLGNAPSQSERPNIPPP